MTSYSTSDFFGNEDVDAFRIGQNIWTIYSADLRDNSLKTGTIVKLGKDEAFDGGGWAVVDLNGKQTNKISVVWLMSSLPRAAAKRFNIVASFTDGNQPLDEEVLKFILEEVLAALRLFDIKDVEAGYVPE